ncbi:hypothetical protein ATO11_09570 [Pseudaestuariivita atlantica]|uniref:N-(5'-phosphoribosyl)anthranilate isomerase n=1 Tax=Pseudaestuariivita atlantica TaxID=1317121 RepID=A0A0L1JNY5_9RHOB|nr:hypothetical protein ATO11_09570 [Pseudaestuariivita atlantica]
MNMMPSRLNRPINHGFTRQLFGAKAAQKGGVVRRSKRDVHREVGLDHLMREVTRRGFHLVESGDQYVIICHPGHIRILC